MASTSDEISESKKTRNSKKRNYLPEECCGPDWVTLPKPSPELFGLARNVVEEEYQLLTDLCYKTQIAYITTNHAFRRKYSTLKKIRERNDLTSEELDNFKSLCKKTVEELSAYIKLKELQQEVIQLINQTDRVQKRDRFGFCVRLNGVRLTETKNILVKACNTTPLFIPNTPNAKAPELCGAIPAGPNYVAKIGDLVAARVEYNNDWILAEVLHWHKELNQYQIADIDDTEQRGSSLLLDRSDVIPLPKYRANPLTNPEAIYPIGTDVRALYPQTTCFYKGKITRLPGQDGLTCYSIRFESTEDNTSNYHAVFFGINVPQHFVIKVPGESGSAVKKPTPSRKKKNSRAGSSKG